ncbi:MAG: PEPxxWA-CTERM sorting domain-containing protein [Sphingomonadaceae bacterium]|nr:PEPxxWA-CTERM sorting domain-containing protein [Sphingomonadaceae bacterium]
MAFSRTGIRRLLTLVASASLTTAAGATLPTQSWNGYHWQRTGPLAIQLGSNVGSAWGSYVAAAATEWSAANNIDFVQVRGTSPTSACNPVFGTVQVCNGNYGKNGWLGYATVYASGTVILEATVKLNDYYFAGGTYDTAAWRAQTACQEIGHTLGLAHNDTIRTDANKGTCMDYTNDPTGTRGTNGTLANLTPGASDFAALNVIYAHVDTTQLPQTRPSFRASDALSLGDDGPDAIQALPEPATWALFVAGFGGVGAMLRRRQADLRIA